MNMAHLHAVEVNLLRENLNTSDAEFVCKVRKQIYVDENIDKAQFKHVHKRKHVPESCHAQR
jgi:hypothetical protein